MSCEALATKAELQALEAKLTALLSGKIDQTEKPAIVQEGAAAGVAIALGLFAKKAFEGIAEEALDLAWNAKDIATIAKNLGLTAKEVAEDAISSAMSAEEVAGWAKITSELADAKAGNAIGKAVSAETKAVSAIGKAEDAFGKAVGAFSKAEDAIGKAVEALGGIGQIFAILATLATLAIVWALQQQVEALANLINQIQNVLTQEINLLHAKNAEQDAKINETIEKANFAIDQANIAVNDAQLAIGKSDLAIGKANESISKSNLALKTAQIAIEQAASAITTANAAELKSNQALTTANAAELKATTAIATANAAELKAIQAQEHNLKQDAKITLLEFEIAKLWDALKQGFDQIVQKITYVTQEITNQTTNYVTEQITNLTEVTKQTINNVVNNITNITNNITNQILNDPVDIAKIVAMVVAMITPTLQNILNNTYQINNTTNNIYQNTTFQQLQNAAANGICQECQPGGCVQTQIRMPIQSAVNSVGNQVAGVAAGVTSLGGLVASQFASLGATLFSIAGSTATILTRLGPQVVGGLSGGLSRVFDVLKVDRWLNAINHALLWHNALMLSANLAESFFSVADTILQAAGLQMTDVNGNPITIGESVSTTIKGWAENILGAENLAQLSATLAKVNRIYQAAANILYSVQNIFEAGRAIADLTLSRIGIIGNALRRFGVVADNAYGWMDEQVTPMTQYSKFVDGIDQAEESLSHIDSVASSVITIKDETTQIKEQKEEWKNAQNDLLTDYVAEKEQEKTDSIGPNIDNPNVGSPYSE